MTERKPKLLIVGGPTLPAGELARQLQTSFDVEIAGPGGADGAARVGVDAVLAPAGGFGWASDHPAGLLLNAIGEGACLVDEQGRELWANDAYRALDVSLRQAARACAREAHHVLAPGRDGGDGAACKFVVGGVNDSSASEVFVSRPGGAGPLAVVVRDISAQRRLERRMDAIDRAGAELVGLDAEAIRRHNAAERLGMLEKRIVRVAHELLHFDHFLIRVIDEKTRRLETVISVGVSPEAAELELFAEAEGNGISGLVAATGRSYVCADTEHDERFMPGLTNARSSLTMPLRLHDRVIGVMNVESQQAHAFGEEDRRFGEIFARYIAIALHMLDLLVVERSSTNLNVSDRVEGELKDCLEDIVTEADWLTGLAARDPETARHVARIKADVESIRARVRNMAAGPQTLLGVERALGDKAEDPLLRGRRVLVADDEERIRRIIRDVLRSRGCEVAVCENGLAAAELIEACARGERPAFELIISDIKMPDRNGYEVFAVARRAIPGVPVILMTGFGYDPSHSIVRASSEGLQSVLFKPFQIERLIEEVRKTFAPKPA